MFKATSIKTLIKIGLLGCVVAAPAVTAAEITGDAIKGEVVYARCMGCHSPERNRTGPKHCGLVGRIAGTAEGFDYSQAMQKSDIVWNKKTLDQFLTSPLKFVPGTTMAIGGISNKTDRHNLVSYLASLDSDAKCQ